MATLFFKIGGLLLLGMSCVPGFQIIYEKDLPADHPAIGYLAGELNDDVARLDRQIQKGAVSLGYAPDGSGYLSSLLENLKVSRDSQTLVFSKTSFQSDKISPRHPRAIYFNDSVAIGFVSGGDVIELAGLDSHRGIAFYSLDNSKAERPKLVRREICLKCHQGPATVGVPGIFISSVNPSSSGAPSRTGGIVTDHRTNFEERWGGWYVTGSHGDQRHRGNAVAPSAASPDELEWEGTQNLVNLLTKFIPPKYMDPVSDIVALMTLEHQTQMTNLMTRVAWEVRIGKYDRKADPVLRAHIESRVDQLVTYMLFRDEIALKGPIRGISTFTKTFSERGPRDRLGRSLRDFDLRRRLFRYPLSYMIYSPAFDALPDLVLDRVYRRLYDVLRNGHGSDSFANLSQDDRSSILDILRETKPNLPGYWKRLSN